MRLLFLQSGNLFFVLYFSGVLSDSMKHWVENIIKVGRFSVFSSISGMLDEINNAIFAVS